MSVRVDVYAFVYYTCLYLFPYIDIDVGKCATRKIHTNQHPGRLWCIFHILGTILISEDFSNTFLEF